LFTFNLLVKLSSASYLLVAQLIYLFMQNTFSLQVTFKYDVRHSFALASG